MTGFRCDWAAARSTCLSMLAGAAGDVVTKDELLARVWPGFVVEENNLQVQISALRKALDEDQSGHSFLITVPGRGYRLHRSYPLKARTTPALSGQAVDRRPALPEYERRSRAGILRRRHGRGHHHGAVAHALAVRDRPQFELHLQGPGRRREAGRPRARRALCARRQRAQGGNRVRITGQLIDARPAPICGPSASMARSRTSSICRTR